MLRAPYRYFGGLAVTAGARLFVDGIYVGRGHQIAAISVLGRTFLPVVNIAVAYDQTAANRGISRVLFGCACGFYLLWRRDASAAAQYCVDCLQVSA